MSEFKEAQEFCAEDKEGMEVFVTDLIYPLMPGHTVTITVQCEEDKE